MCCRCPRLATLTALHIRPRLIEQYKELDAGARQAGQDVVTAEGRAQEAMQGAGQAATPGGGGGPLPPGWQETREPGSGQTCCSMVKRAVLAAVRPTACGSRRPRARARRPSWL